LAEDKSDENGTAVAQELSARTRVPALRYFPADTSPYTTGWQLDPAFAKIIGINPDSKPGVDNSN
jgi:hypothetical protein